jgi:DNA-binding GntR family transcriptional regulator
MPRALKNGSRPESLSIQAHSALEELIVTLKLPPGSLWTEVELCEMIGIGRTPVHEAVQRLASQHLVSVIRRHGLMISKVNIEEQLLVLEILRELERLIVTKATRRITESEKKELVRLAEGMMQASKDNDLKRFLHENYITKKFIAECARNPFAAEAIAPLLTLSLRFYHIHYQPFNDLSQVANFHNDEIKAILAGDEILAARASDKVIDNTEAFTRYIFMKRL